MKSVFFSHWIYFIIFAGGHAIMVPLLWGHAVWSMANGSIAEAFKVIVLIQVIYFVLAGLFFVFRLLGRWRGTETY